MLGTCLVSRNCFGKFGVTDPRLNVVFGELKRHAKLKQLRSYSFCRKTMNSGQLKRLFVGRPSNVVKCSSYRCLSLQAAVSKKEKDEPAKSHFQEVLHARKMQAHRSVLVEVTKKEDIPFAVDYFNKYGSIANIYSYFGERENCFLLIEFSNEIDAQELLLHCGFQNIADVFPIRSRIIKYEKNPDTSLPEVNFNINEESSSELSFKEEANISEVIAAIYSSEKLTELDMRLRFFLCSLIKDSISGLFPHCDVLPFGSSVNGIGRRGCDLDLVIRLYPEKVNGDGKIFFMNRTCVGQPKKLQQDTLYYLRQYLRFSPGVSVISGIMMARVPILKMKHSILKMDIDVSVNNMSAILMSDILHFCGEIDSRVRPLIHVVKKWAKEADITKPTPGAQISNFGLANLVLFFLQTREPRILPPLNDALVILGSDNSYDFRIQYLKSIEDWKTENKEPLAVLLKDFFIFLTTYPFHQGIISLLSGETRPHNDNSMPLYIEYPLDESLNITKNVSKCEYDVLRDMASISAESLVKNLEQKVHNVKDFSALLGIPKSPRGTKPKSFNIYSVIENEKTSKMRNPKYRA